jgi:hypothetical protein
MEENPLYRRPIIIVPVLLLLCGAVWFFFVRDRTPRLKADGAKQQATTFLEQIRSGQIDEAWAATSADFKSMYGRDRFHQYVKAHPVLKVEMEFVNCQFVTEGELRLAKCQFKPLGATGQIEVVLHPETDRWRIGRLSID